MIQEIDERDVVCEVAHPLQGRAGPVRSLLPPPRTVIALADIFGALADPTRLRILSALARGELCVCDLADVLDLSVSAVSHQLKLLRTLRLVKARKAGRQAFYSLDDGHVERLLQEGLRHVVDRHGADPAPDYLAEVAL